MNMTSSNPKRKSNNEIQKPDKKRSKRSQMPEHVFSNILTYDVDNQRISVTDEHGAINYYAHPTGNRLFSYKRRASTIVLENVILKVRVGNRYYGEKRVNLVLSVRFPGNIIDLERLITDLNPAYQRRDRVLDIKI